MVGAVRPIIASCGSIHCLPRAPKNCCQAVFGDDASLQPLKQLLIERTEGNPFFLEESVRTLVETKGFARRARQVSSGGLVRDYASPCHRPCGVSRAHRPAFGRRETSASIGGSHRQGCAVCPAPSHRRLIGRRTATRNSVSFKQLSFFTRRACFPISNTRSSMR